ncbi:MAG TPA: hypothetical protein VEQ13_01660 [Methylomirabilota bacterium]|nr:hypothetical protein [Methylomirabilota bacterium]
MRKDFFAGIVLVLLVAACSSPRAASSAAQVASCINATAPHHAYVVVQHLSGASLQRCVGFNGAMIDGQTLMDESGLQYGAHELGSGKSMCQVDNEPAQYSQCFPSKQPYWALFVEQHGVWSSSPGGFTDVKLHDAEALGWHYVPAADSTPAPPPVAQTLAGMGA